VLGTPALSATVYGNVSSSIYYALGVTALFALGLTPLVFLVAGIIFAATTMTYAEGTVRFPEAGGSSSFARHAFNELVSFGAAWAQMLNYVITISISAFFVPHYLAIFWKPLEENPWDVVGGAIVIVFLICINIIGTRESTRINVVLAVVDFATQLLLVLLGFALVFNPHVLEANIHWGRAPTWGDFLLAIPVGMIAYTGIETLSNLAEETRDPAKNVPRAYLLTAIAVFAIFFTLPAIALSAMPVNAVGGEFVTSLGLPPEQGGFANNPVLGIVENLGISGVFLDVMRVFVGLIAATILLVAANAGVIGASRITYAMAGYRQLPTIFRRLHPRFGTPWMALIVFAGIVSTLTLLPGEVDFLGTMYSFGAMLSFTIAHVSIVALRYRRRADELVFKGRPNARFGGVDWPLFALLGAVATGLAWISVVVQIPTTRWAGLGWLLLGFAIYAIYRRGILRVPLTTTLRAPTLVIGPALELRYRTIVVPVVRSVESEEALVAAARLAAERRATIAVVHVIEVPLERRLDAVHSHEEDDADLLLDQARGLVESYGVRTVVRLVRARRAGPAIVQEAVQRDADLIVMGAARRPARRRTAIFGPTVDQVLKASQSRVLLAAGRRAA
jgi:APA family basic amino acid/polyamine antiporter